MTRRLGLYIVFVIVCVMAAFFLWRVFTEPGRSQAKANEARAGQVVAEGRRDAATDAIEVIGINHDRDTAIDLQTRENDHAIRNAPGASAPVDPGLDAATRRAICLRASARADPACVALLNPRPR